MTWEELKEKAKGIGFVVIKTCLGGESLSKGDVYFTEHGEYYIQIDGYTTYTIARYLGPDQMWQIMEALKMSEEKGAYKNFIEFEADTLPDTNVFYATIIATLNKQLEEANEVIKKYVNLGNWNDYYNEHVGEVADDMQKYLEKWGVK